MMVVLYSNIYLQIIGEYFKRNNAVLGHEQELEFEAESICLDVPDLGVKTDQSWTIAPLHHPEVFSYNMHDSSFYITLNLL